MSRWFRFYDEAMHDAKLLRLSDAMFRAWMTLLCVASKNDGALPPASEIALTLRCKPSLVAGWIAELVASGLIDKTKTGFEPHNWSERQYKSDSSAERMKRHRSKQRDVTSDVTVTVQNRAETETDTETEQITEANASGADAPADARTRLFRSGLSDLGEITGKGPDACRSFVGKCLQAAGDDAVVVLGLIEDAKRNRVANPSAWIAARLKPTASPASKPRTAHQQERETGREILNALRDASSRTDPGFLRHDTGNGPESLRGGVRGAIVDLSAARDRTGYEPIEGSRAVGQLPQSGKISGAS